jgi:hypothetical protein
MNTRVNHVPQEYWPIWPIQPVEFNEAMVQVEWGSWNRGITPARHFYVDDWRFESVWRQPVETLITVIDLDYVTAPDFSIWPEHSEPVARWQLFRSHQVCGYWQYNGINVIPSLNWTTGYDPGIFVGSLPRHSTVAVRGPTRFYIKEWTAGASALQELLEPTAVLHFGNKYGIEVWNNGHHVKLNQKKS